MNTQHQVQVHIIKVICKSCMYRKIMIQIYLLEDVCKKLYVKVVFRHYNFSEKNNVDKKPFQKKEIKLLSEIARCQPS